MAKFTKRISTVLNDSNIDIYSDEFATALYGLLNTISQKNRYSFNDEEWSELKQEALMKFYAELDAINKGKESILSNILSDRHQTFPLCYNYLTWMLKNAIGKERLHISRECNKNTDDEGKLLEELLESSKDNEFTEENYYEALNECLVELMANPIENQVEIQRCRKLMEQPMPYFKHGEPLF